MRSAIITIHYGEIALKGKNRGVFEKRLLDNVYQSLREITSDFRLARLNGRFLLTLPDELSQDIKSELIQRLNEIPGITYFGVGFAVTKDIKEIEKTAVEIFKDLPYGTFKIETRRGDKTFQFSSPQVNKQIGQVIVDRFGLPVNLSRPDNILYIEITHTDVLIYSSRHEGVGGLPVGISGNVLALISAGFDSPAASYMMMKRGAKVYFVHFHSYPYVSRNSIDQVEKLIKRLSDFQYVSTCYFVPLAEIQKKIMIAAPPSYRVLMYRRAMVRLAEYFAGRHNCEALVTGDSLGQVASQTLRNVRIVDDATRLPIFRPLIGMDKEEIIKLSRKIGTFDISAQPYDDCCSFLMPRQVETWGSIDKVREIENSFDYEAEFREAIDRTEIKKIKNRYTA